MPHGYLCFVLHAHLPYVRHPEYDDFLEEDWLYEAITETYIPLLDAFEELERKGADFRITMSISPTLAGMLADPLLQCRYVRHLENLIDLTHSDFLHADVVGDEKMDKEVVEVFYDTETITMVRTCRNKTVAPIMQKAAGIKAKTQNVRFTVHIYVRSHVAAIYSRFDPGVDVRLLHCSTPETRDSNTVNFIQDTRGAKRPYRYLFPLASYKIVQQDDYALRPQAPRYHEEIRRRDLHSRFDAASVRYRALVQDILERQARGDYSYESDALISGDKTDVLGIGKPV